MNARRWTFWLIGLVATLGACMPFRSHARGISRAPAIDFDTTAVVIEVANFYPQDVSVHVESEGKRVCIGKVAARHNVLFVLPSERVQRLAVFTVSVSPPGAPPLTIEPVQRQPGRMSRVFVRVGPQPGEPDAVRVPSPVTEER